MATPTFYVSNGQIIGPNGQPFKAQGIDILDATIGNVVGDPSGGALLQNFPDTNFVRLMLWSGYQLSQSAINAIDWLTAKGIVVEICNYNGWPTVPTGSQLTQEVNFFSQIATTYKDNPYVWFNTENEPQDVSIGLPAGSISAEQTAVYNAIRASGNTSMIGLDLMGGYTTTDLVPSAYSSMTNVFWDQHYYDWMSNYSSDVAANQNALSSEIANDQSIHSADGTMPVIVGEFGNATDGANTDPGATQAVQAVLNVGPQYSGYSAFTYYWPASWGGTPGGDQLTNESTGTLTPYGQQIAAGMNASYAPAGGGGTTTPPPPSPTPSSNGTKITSASASPIIDQNGNAWTLVQSASNGLQIAVNGTVDTPTANVVLLETLNGAMVQENSSGNWYSETTPNDSWTQIANPNPTVSPSGTTIKSSSSAPIIDQNGNAWSLVQSVSNGLQIAINGTVDAPTANVVLLETLSGAMVQENTASNWYSETTPNDSWTQIANPNPTSPLPTQSPNGTKITSASASPIIDQDGNAWCLVQSASNGLQIAINGTVDVPTANVVLLETLDGTMVQENTAGNWYSETTPNDSWTQIANPNPTQPSVVSAITTSPGSGDLTVGDIVTLTVTFSSAVAVASGTPALALNDGGTATYVSGSGGSALVFKYTVAAGQNTADLAPAASSAITLNGATIRDTSGNNAVLTGANGYNPAGTLQIDTTPPKLSAIATSPGSGQVATGGTVTLTATFSEAVTVAGGTPALALNDGGTATYLSGSGSSALVFKYTVAAGQSTTDLKLAASNAVALNGGTIRDRAGNNAVLTSANGYLPAGTLAINPPAPPPASNGFLITPGAGTFKDAAGNTYGVDSSDNANENGQPIPGGGGTSAMAYFNGIVYGQDAGSGQWYTWNQTAWTPAASSMLDVTTAGTLTKNLSQTGTFAENGDNFVLSGGNVVKATLGSGNDTVGFIGPQQVVLTGGSGAATVLAAGGNNTFTAGSGSLDVTAGAGKDAYVFRSTSGLLTLEDFSLAKGDTLTIDKALQGSLHEATDGKGGTMLSFGANTGQGVDLHGLAALPSTNIVWA